MDKKKLTRLMIDTIVKRGIGNMADDPRRSIRRLADLGRQFSTGRFQDDIIDIIQTILADENSPYYIMIQSFLDNTDHTCIRKLCINIGYNSWTYDARTLRKKSAELGYVIPWLIIFNLDDNNTKDIIDNNIIANTNDTKDINTKDSCPALITPEYIKEKIEEARSLGINSFSIMQTGGNEITDKIIDIFRENEESAFFYFLENENLTDIQIAAIKECKNVMISINADKPQSSRTSKQLHDAKLLYSIHHYYDDNDFDNVSSLDANSESLKKYYDYQSSMVFLIPKEGCKSHGETVKNIRLEGKFPCFIWDMYYDAHLISQRLLGEENGFLELAKDGTILKPGSPKSSSLKTASLTDIIKAVMPKYTNSPKN